MSHPDSSRCWRRRSFTFDCGFIFTPIFFNYCNLGETDSDKSILAFRECFNTCCMILSSGLKHVRSQVQFFEPIVRVRFFEVCYWEKQLPKYGSLKHIFETNEIMLVEEVHSLYAEQIGTEKV